MNLTVKPVSASRGLMFRRKQKLPVMLDARKFKSLHTWFCFFSMDVAFLDVLGRVIGTARLRPFSMCRLPRGTVAVLEGVKLGLKEGDVVDLMLDQNKK